MKYFKIEFILPGCTIDGFETSDKTIKTESFETLKEAKNAIKRLIKEEGFERAYYVFDRETGIELHTNFC